MFSCNSARVSGLGTVCVQRLSKVYQHLTKSECETFYNAKFIILQNNGATLNLFGKKIRAQQEIKMKWITIQAAPVSFYPVCGWCELTIHTLRHLPPMLIRCCSLNILWTFKMKISLACRITVCSPNLIRQEISSQWLSKLLFICFWL